METITRETLINRIVISSVVDADEYWLKKFEDKFNKYSNQILADIYYRKTGLFIKPIMSNLFLYQ
jgi:hypothetical protein